MVWSARIVKDVKNALEDLKFSNVKTVAAKSEDPDTKPGEVIEHLAEGRLDGTAGQQDHRQVCDRQVGRSELRRSQLGPRRSEWPRTPASGSRSSPSGRARKPSGTVIAQSPRAGATVDRDTTIRLTLAVSAAADDTAADHRAAHRTAHDEPATPTPTPTKTKKTPQIRIHNRIVLD